MTQVGAVADSEGKILESDYRHGAGCKGTVPTPGRSCRSNTDTALNYAMVIRCLDLCRFSSADSFRKDCV